MSTYREMAEACQGFLAGLSGDQRAVAVYPFGADHVRRDWTYVPRDRVGLSFGDLDRPQRKAVHRLLATALSPHAYAQAVSIMALEDVLDHREGGGRGRHASDYWTVVFGDPAPSAAGEAWGWRFEGHHVSVTVTAVDGEVSVSPCFLGANPAIVRHGDAVVVRPLAREEELARSLLAELGTVGRTAAVVADTAPDDIRTRSAARLGAELVPLGIAGGNLTGTAADLLDALVDLYLQRMPPDLAAAHRPDRQLVHFAWEGSLTRDAGHYYRLQALTPEGRSDLLIEYDNTQNDANHIHSVCRLGPSDFGDDLLARHYAQHPH